MKTTNRIGLAGAVAFSVTTAALVAGCSGGDGSIADGTTDPGVETVSQAVAQPGCETAPKDDDQQPAAYHPPGLCVGGFSNSTTPAYGSATCPNRWLVGYGAFTGNATASAKWTDSLPTNSTDCGASTLELDTFTESGGIWTLHSATVHGAWFAGSCSVADVVSTVGPGNKHRLAAVAYRAFGPLRIKQNLTVRLSRCGS